MICLLKTEGDSNKHSADTSVMLIYMCVCESPHVQTAHIYAHTYMQCRAV